MRTLTKIRMGISNDPTCPRVDIYMHYDDGHEESGDFGQGFPGPTDGIENAFIDSTDMGTTLTADDLLAGYEHVLKKCNMAEVPLFNDGVFRKGEQGKADYLKAIELRFGEKFSDIFRREMEQDRIPRFWSCDNDPDPA